MNEQFNDYVSFVKRHKTDIDTKSIIQKKKRFFSWKLVMYGVLTSLVLFVGSIRMIPTFAKNLAEIPFLRDFVLLFQPSASLKEAFENEYYQVIDQSMTVAGITIQIEATMVDEYAVSVFYRILNINPDELSRYHLDVEAPAMGEYAMTNSGYQLRGGADNNGLNEIHFSYIDPHIKDTIDLTLILTNGETSREFPFVIPVDTSNIGKTREFIIHQEKSIVDEKLSDDVLHLSFEKIRITPSKATMFVPFQEDSDFYIRKVEYVFIDDEGNESEEIKNGVVAFGWLTGDRQFMVESKYFNLDQYHRIKIKGFELVPKSQYHVWYDVATKTFHNLNENYYNVSLEMTGRKVVLRYHLLKRVGNLTPLLSVDEEQTNATTSSSSVFYGDPQKENTEFVIEFTLNKDEDVIYFTNQDAIYFPYELIIELKE